MIRTGDEYHASMRDNPPGFVEKPLRQPARRAQVPALRRGAAR
jgi:hypothetical protein